MSYDVHHGYAFTCMGGDIRFCAGNERGRRKDGFGGCPFDHCDGGDVNHGRRSRRTSRANELQKFARRSEAHLFMIGKDAGYWRVGMPHEKLVVVGSKYGHLSWHCHSCGIGGSKHFDCTLVACGIDGGGLR